jgi:4-hydroxy-3-methylbut-2-enyl diphosphate reductase
MKVRLARTAGFCYGVERAVDMVCEEVKRKQASCGGKDTDGQAGAKIYTYGPIVHNDSVVKELESQGVSVIRDLDDLREKCGKSMMEGASVVIRAHGVGQEVMDILTDPRWGIRVVDATCPFVKKIHDIVREHHAAGEKIIITGTESHPEVQGILGQIGFDAAVIESMEDAGRLAEDISTGRCGAIRSESRPEDNVLPARYCVVSQTTFNTEKFKDIVDFLKKQLYYVTVVNTICNATQLRQKEALALSRECDAMIVIGGKHSSNTAKLYDICSKECSATYFIESLDDLNETIDQSVRCFGITAGASTPKTIIQEVLKYVRDEF